MAAIHYTRSGKRAILRAIQQQPTLFEAQQMLIALSLLLLLVLHPITEPSMHFVPIPPHIGIGGYWLKDLTRTTPSPQPVDVMLGANWLVRKAHDSIPGILVSDFWLRFEGGGLRFEVRVYGYGLGLGLGVNWLVKNAHDSIPGILVNDVWLGFRVEVRVEARV